MINSPHASIEDLRDMIRARYLTVFADLPNSQPLSASHRIAMREVQENIITILPEIKED